MIEINLVPPELRKKRKRNLIPGGINIPIEVVIGSGGGLIILLFLVHLILLFNNISKLADHKKLENQWEEILPAKEGVDIVINEMRELQNQYKAITKLTNDKNRIIWSEKLNIISNRLPRGVWLSRIFLDKNTLLIEGSAISKQKAEMINVHSFASNLKKDERFLVGFSGMELGSIQRRKIKSVEISDFFISATLEEDQDEK